MSGVKTFYEKTLRQVFPPINFAFAYGSAVVHQHGRPKGKMLDLVFAVDDPLEWHKTNLLWNKHHYSFLRSLGVDSIVGLQRSSAGVYYNTLVTVNNQLLKYGVISTEDLLDDLLNWKWLYISGRLHKPVLYLTPKEDGSPISNAIKQNHESAALCGVLLQESSEFTEKQLFTRITQLSYNVDAYGQLLILLNAAHNFPSKYVPDFRGFSPMGGGGQGQVEYSEGNMIKKIEVLRSSLERLPRTVRQHIKNGQSLDKALNAIVRSSSIMQSSKGILTAGLKKSVEYSFSKLEKMLKSYSG